MKAILSIIFLSVIMNAAAQWKQTNGPEEISVSHLIRTSNGYIFVSANGSGDPLTHGNLYRSTNNGDTWEMVYNGVENQSVYVMVEFPIVVDNNDNIFAFTGTPSGLVNVLKSSDYGNTWNLQGTVPTAFTYDAAVNANNSTELYVASQFVYYSLDGGVTWNLKSDTGLKGTALSVAVDDQGTVYAVTSEGFYKSTDKAFTFTEITLPIPTKYGRVKFIKGRLTFRYDNDLLISEDRGATWKKYSLMMNPVDIDFTDNGHIYAGLRYGSVSYSTDNGDSWLLTNLGNSHELSHVLINGNYLFAATHEILRKDLSSDIWERKTNGIISSKINDIAVDGNIIYAATGEGTSKSTDFGVTWQHLQINDLSNDAVAASGDLVFTGGYSGGLYRSTDGGNTWIQSTKSFSWIRAINISKSGRVFVSSLVGLNVSTDGGVTFSQITQVDDRNARGFTFSPDSSIIYAGINRKLYKSSDEGDNWTEISLAQYTGLIDIHNLAVNSKGDIVIGISSVLLHTNDNAATWDTTFLPSGARIQDVKFFNDTLYISSNFGLIKSPDLGKTMIYANLGLKNKAVMDVEITKSGIKVLGSTGDGVYVEDFGVTDVESIQNNTPQSFTLYQNFPNPFNPSTTIRYELSTKQFVSVKIYDALGNEIATLVNEEKPAGSYEISFTASSANGEKELSSGIYFYQIRAGNLIQTRKMMLIK